MDFEIERSIFRPEEVEICMYKGDVALSILEGIPIRDLMTLKTRLDSYLQEI